MKFLIFLVLFTTGLSGAFAETQYKLGVQLKHDTRLEKHLVKVFQYELPNKILAVRIEGATLPRIRKNINPVLGFGRDLDGDKKIESWFLTTTDGVKYFYFPSKSSDASDGVREILKKHSFSPDLNGAESLFISSLGFLVTATDQLYDAYRLYIERQVDIQSMSVILKRHPDAFTRDQHISILGQIMEGNKLAYQDYAQALKDNNANTYRDMLIWGTGMKLAGWALQSLKHLSKGPVASATVTAFAQQGARAGWMQVAALVSRTTGAMVTKVRTSLTLQGSKAILKSSARRFGQMVPYTVSMAGLQTGVEGWARMDEVRGKTHLETVKNILTHPQIIENVAIGAAETLLMAGLMNDEKSGMLSKFILCGFVSVGSSLGVGEVLEGGQEDTRVWLDGVLTIPDIALLGVDLWLINNFDNWVRGKAGMRPAGKLKPLGYAVAVVISAGGYFAYSKMTDAAEHVEKSKEKVILVPVFAED